jgi:hypothetical protein
VAALLAGFLLLVAAPHARALRAALARAAAARRLQTAEHVR